jgi:F-type H+-transporting ATPase subunit b
MDELRATILQRRPPPAEAGGGSNFLIPNGTFFAVLIIFLIVLGVTKWLCHRSARSGRAGAMLAKTTADNRKSAEQVAAAQADYDGRCPVHVRASSIRDEARSAGRQVIDEKRPRRAARWPSRARGG